MCVYHWFLNTVLNEKLTLVTHLPFHHELANTALVGKAVCFLSKNGKMLARQYIFCQKKCKHSCLNSKFYFLFYYFVEILLTRVSIHAHRNRDLAHNSNCSHCGSINSPTEPLKIQRVVFPQPFHISPFKIWKIWEKTADNFDS